MNQLHQQPLKIYPIIIFLFSSLFIPQALAQSKFLISKISKKVKLFNIHNGDTLLSIGAGDGIKEFGFSLVTDSVHYYLEDIDTIKLNPSVLELQKKNIQTKSNKPNTNSFSIVPCDTSSINWASHYFNRILMIDVFHEIQDQEKILKEIARLLKPNGELVIEENVSPDQTKFSNYHCHLTYLLRTEKDFLKFMEENKYYLKQMHKLTKYERVFVFKKAK